MARCDAGYFCHVCGEYVDNVTVSELYLRYVLNEVRLEQLFSSPDAHLWCNPVLAQYIVDPAYRVDPAVHPRREVPPELDKRRQDPAWVKRREEQVTRAWRRLQELPALGIPIQDYPLDRK